MKPLDLVNPGWSNKALDDLMNRVGANMGPREFVRLVSNTYHKHDAERYNVVRSIDLAGRVRLPVRWSVSWDFAG